MKIENIRQFIKEKAEQFGAKSENEYNKPYVERNNTGQEALKRTAYSSQVHPLLKVVVEHEPPRNILGVVHVDIVLDPAG